MLQLDNAPVTVVTLDLNAKVFELAGPLGINVSETMDRLLLEGVVKKRCQ
ncbi:MAG: hypothetical protein Q8R33_16525 [Burkholderiales bacterium]|nr:hypothetical protein [Burkholderiales bacterium]